MRGNDHDGRKLSIFQAKDRRLFGGLAHPLLSMYALRQHAQHLCPRVLALSRPGFLTLADVKGNVGATRAYITKR
jgi:hypothetical protein